MKNFWMILGAIAVALGIAPAADAAKPTDIGLNFDLAPSPIRASSSEAIAAAPPPTAADRVPSIGVKPLALPKQGANVPMRGSSNKAGVASELPPPPDVALISPEPVLEAAEPQPEVPPAPQQPIQFDAAATALPAEPVAIAPPVPAAPTAPTAPPTPAAQSLEALFQGQEHSLVARAVGSAEGTRTADGGKTWAYRGHTDPGNGVWNMGTFSYQHGADTPEEADRKQLKRLMGQAETLRQHAADRGITLTLEEELNGIDLANQSPRAALSRGGYMDRLKQAHEMGLQGADAVLWARTRAFLDPDTSRWNAPGLGNNVHSITADQERRRKAIARAIEATATPLAEPPIATAPPEPRRNELAAAPPDQQEAIANQIISLDLPPT